MTLTPTGSDQTERRLVASANVDNFFALLSSPGKKIITRFKDGL